MARSSRAVCPVDATLGARNIMLNVPYHRSDSSNCAGVVTKQDGSEMSDMHAFPTVEQLQAVTEDDLRSNGFGYRAAYIAQTACLLHEKAAPHSDTTGAFGTVSLLTVGGSEPDLLGV